jgi:uncharacterized protein
MRYNVAQLLKGPIGGRRVYELNENVNRLDTELEFICPVTGSVTFTRTGQGILVVGGLRTVLRGACRRCLEPCDLVVEIDLEDEFHPVVPIGQGGAGKAPEEEDDEALWIDEHHVLDLSEVIRQELAMVDSSEALCRPDCAGLCPRCGGNRDLGECQCDETPVDPRWATLQILLSNESDSLERSD